MPVPTVIVDVVRTPMGKGKPGGALASLHPVDLLAQTLTALVERSDIDRAGVEDTSATPTNLPCRLSTSLKIQC